MAEARESALHETNGPVLAEYSKASRPSISPRTSRAHAPSSLVSPISPIADEKDEAVVKEVEKNTISSTSAGDGLSHPSSTKLMCTI
jgi:hypothetical protein